MRDIVDEAISTGMLELVPAELYVRATDAAHGHGHDVQSTALGAIPAIGGTQDKLPMGGPPGVTGRASTR
jgi:hypothetical protein